MKEEAKITMNEFKTVVESFRSELKKVVEVMNHGFETARKERQGMKEQIGLLLEGQTEIRAALKEKASIEDLKRLDKRVTRLERKTA